MVRDLLAILLTRITIPKLDSFGMTQSPTESEDTLDPIYIIIMLEYNHDYRKYSQTFSTTPTPSLPATAGKEALIP